MRFRLLPTLILAGLLAACDSDVATPFVEDAVEGFEQNTASLPEATADEPYPELLTLIQANSDPFDFVHARGYVHAPIARVWEAMKTPDVVADRRAVDEYSVTQDVEPEYVVSFRIRNVVHDFVTVEFENTWRQDVLEGTEDEPTQVVCNYKKTWGTSFIDLMEGSITLNVVTPDVTEFAIVQHLDATSADSDEIASASRDMYASVVAFVHDQALPTY
ncbi:MAG: hypothetical protein IPK60_02425 [Sandaracinaceae bacterium]|nr:hypothetical protein [Sandaracinaceae bacterium]